VLLLQVAVEPPHTGLSLVTRAEDVQGLNALNGVHEARHAVVVVDERNRLLELVAEDTAGPFRLCITRIFPH
jgi:hypothetical protein